jgi:hypothetical protein
MDKKVDEHIQDNPEADDGNHDPRDTVDNKENPG